MSIGHPKLHEKKFSEREKGFLNFVDFAQEVYKRNGDGMPFIKLLITNT
jgi:hypothetical protein